MRRSTVFLSIVLMAGLILGVGSVDDARAQLPLSFRVSALGSTQQAEITASAPGVDLPTSSTSLYGVGAEVEVGLPIGLHVGGHYLRHFGDLSDEFTGGSTALQFGLGANELGLFVEKQFALVPMSPVKPFVGAGVGYGRIGLSQDLDVEAAATETLDSNIDVYRVYALGGLSIFGSLGVKARAGYLFGSIDGEDFSVGQTFTTPGGEEISFELDYSGFYASLAVSVFGF